MSGGEGPDAGAGCPAALVARKGPALEVTLNDPARRNPLSPEIYAALTDALDRAAADPGIAAVVLTGAGGFFCAGGNVKVLQTRAAMTEEQRIAAIGGLHDVIRALAACPRPVIAAIEGGAAGAGASLALGCDMIVAAEGAALTLSYVRIGLVPDGGATWALARALPRQLAAEILMLGEKQPVERLHALGLVNRVVAPGAALDAAHDIAARLAGFGPEALARIKALLRAAPDSALDAQLDREARAMAEAQGGAEAAEGLAAFLEKRRPDFGKFRR